MHKRQLARGASRKGGSQRQAAKLGGTVWQSQAVEFATTMACPSGQTMPPQAGGMGKRQLARGTSPKCGSTDGWQATCKKEQARMPAVRGAGALWSRGEGRVACNAVNPTPAWCTWNLICFVHFAGWAACAISRPHLQKPCTGSVCRTPSEFVQGRAPSHPGCAARPWAILYNRFAVGRCLARQASRLAGVWPGRLRGWQVFGQGGFASRRRLLFSQKRGGVRDGKGGLRRTWKRANGAERKQAEGLP